jgi:transcriptional regulator with XRE-family HTH domain
MSLRELSLKEAGRVRRRLRDVLKAYPSQKALASKLGVSQQAVSGVLSGEHFAGWRFCRALAKLTGHPSAEALVSESYPPHEPTRDAL